MFIRRSIHNMRDIAEPVVWTHDVGLVVDTARLLTAMHGEFTCEAKSRSAGGSSPVHLQIGYIGTQTFVHLSVN